MMHIDGTSNVFFLRDLYSVKLWSLCFFFFSPFPLIRHLSGHTYYVQGAFSSTNRWMPLMGSRPGVLAAALHWGSSSTMAVTPCPQVVSRLLHQSQWQTCFNWSTYSSRQPELHGLD